MMHHQYPSPDSCEKLLLQKPFNETEKTCMNTRNNYAKQSLSNISEIVPERKKKPPELAKYEKIKNAHEM